MIRRLAHDQCAGGERRAEDQRCESDDSDEAKRGPEAPFDLRHGAPVGLAAVPPACSKPWYGCDRYGKPLLNCRELWFTRADVDGVRRRVRLAEAVVGEGRFWGPIGHGQTTLSTDVRGVEQADARV